MKWNKMLNNEHNSSNTLKSSVKTLKTHYLLKKGSAKKGFAKDSDVSKTSRIVPLSSRDFRSGQKFQSS